MPGPETRVGVVGLGAMGRPIVHRLLESGTRVTVYEHRPGAADGLRDAGASVTTDLPSFVAGIDLVISILPDDAALEAVVAAVVEVGRVRDGLLWLDLTTARPATAVLCAERLEEVGIRFVDAPVSGGVDGATAGRLSMMIGGRHDEVAAAADIIERLATTVTYFGAIGGGQVAKVCNQLLVMGTLELLGEAMDLAAAAGIDPSAVVTALSGGVAGSPLIAIAGRRVIDGDLRPGGRLGFHAKDISTISELVGADALPAYQAVAKVIERLLADGHGDDDHAIIAVDATRRRGQDRTEPAVVTVAHEAGIETRQLPGRDWSLMLGPQNSPSHRLTMSLAVFPQGSGPPPHVHELEDEVVYVLAGTGFLGTPDRPIRLEPGVAFHVPAGLYHGAVNDGTEDLRLLCVFSPPVVPGAYEPATN